MGDYCPVKAKIGNGGNIEGKSRNTRGNRRDTQGNTRGNMRKHCGKQ